MKRFLLLLIVLSLFVVLLVPSCDWEWNGGGGGKSSVNGESDRKSSPAAFSLSNLSILPKEVEPDQPVTISVKVANTGGTQGSHDVVLKINGTQINSKTVNLNPGTSKSVSFSVTTDDTGKYTASVGNLSGSFTVAKAQAVFSLSGLSIKPEEASPNQRVEILVKVTNTGNARGNYDVILNINGKQVDSKPMGIGSGSSYYARFYFTTGNIGTYNVVIGDLSGKFVVRIPPADFVLSNLSVQPREVKPDQTVTISVKVANKGDSPGSYDVILNIDGAQESSKTVNLTPGAGQSITFSVNKGKAGTHNVTIGNLSGSFTVTPVVGVYPVPDSPRGICSDGKYIWVSTRKTVTKLSVDGEVVHTCNVGVSNGDICFDGTNIWVVDGESDTVTKLSANDGSLMGTYDVGTRPVGICFDGTHIWVTNSWSDSVTKLRASDGAVVSTTYRVGDEPMNIFSDGTYIWVTNWDSDTVAKLRASDGAIVGIYNVRNHPRGICYDGTYIWVTNYTMQTITKLNCDGDEIGNYRAGYPHSICFDGNCLWVSSSSGDKVSQYNQNGEKVGTYSVDREPGDICFDGKYIWVVNNRSNTVTKILAR